MIKIGKCPYCGSSDAWYFEASMCRYDEYHVECNDCNATGPVSRDLSIAIAEWNRLSELTEEAGSNDKWICTECSVPCTTHFPKEPTTCPYRSGFSAAARWQRYNCEMHCSRQATAVLVNEDEETE